MIGLRGFDSAPLSGLQGTVAPRLLPPSGPPSLALPVYILLAQTNQVAGHEQAPQILVLDYLREIEGAPPPPDPRVREPVRQHHLLVLFVNTITVWLFL